MESELRVSARPELKRPVLVAAFRGWNDGAQAASLAAGYLAKLWGADQIADVDPEGFFDFQATRPHVSLVDGITRQIEWPETAFYRAKPPRLDRDVVLLLGIEPNVPGVPSPTWSSAMSRSWASSSSSRSVRCSPTCRTRAPRP